MENKHFVVQVILGQTCFAAECKTIHEAYEAASGALSEIAHGDDISRELDRLMEALVKLKNGEGPGYTNTIYDYGVYLHDDED